MPCPYSERPNNDDADEDYPMFLVRKPTMSLLVLASVEEQALSEERAAWGVLRAFAAGQALGCSFYLLLLVIKIQFEHCSDVSLLHAG